MLTRYSRFSRFNSAADRRDVWCGFLLRQVSTKTVMCRLHAVRINSWVVRRKPLVRLQNRRARIRWSTSTRDWTVDSNWRSIVFSNESRFNLPFDEGKIRCRLPIGEAYVPQVLTLRSRRTTSVMVGGYISRSAYTGPENLSSCKEISTIKTTLQFSIIICCHL